MTEQNIINKYMLASILKMAKAVFQITSVYVNNTKPKMDFDELFKCHKDLEKIILALEPKNE